MKMLGAPITFVSGLHIADLEAFHDRLLDIAAQIVASGKECAPLTFILSNGGKLAIVPPPASKTALANFQKMVVREPMVRACAIVFEAWVSAKAYDERKTNSDFMPVDDPERSEAIVVSIMTAGRQAMSTSAIERPSNVVKKAPFEWLDEARGEHLGRFVR